MATWMKTGLTAGAAANVTNVVIWHLGRRIARSTVNGPGVTSPRTLLSRVTVNDSTAGTPYTVVNS